MVQIVLCDIKHCDIIGQRLLRYDVMTCVVMTCAHTCIASALGTVSVSVQYIHLLVFYFAIRISASFLLNRPKTIQVWRWVL